MSRCDKITVWNNYLCFFKDRLGDPNKIENFLLCLKKFMSLSTFITCYVVSYDVSSQQLLFTFFLSACLVHFKHLGYMLHCRYKRLAVTASSVRKDICVGSCISVLCMRDQCYCVADMNVTYCRQYPKDALIMFIRVFANITLNKMT
jgi:hypothetical protein